MLRAAFPTKLGCTIQNDKYMLEREKKALIEKLEQIKSDLKPLIEKHYKSIDLMDVQDKTSAFIDIDRCLSEVLKREFDYTLVVRHNEPPK